MEQKIIIAIDGFSSCGKSTLAKDLARKLGYRYIDTGAMYRAVTYYLLQHNIGIEDEAAINHAISDVHIDFDYDKITGKQITLLDGKSIEKEIRSPEISDKVSPVSAIKSVRQYLVRQQQKLGLNKGIIMDGRDIGTVVFPNAELKIFMTADEEVRINRRLEEFQANRIVADRESVRENIQKRDYIDSHREESPLRKADDAIELDNSNMTIEEQVEWACQKIADLVKC